MRAQEISRIAMLPEKVMNKIAAAEVVVRPVDVVKELIENCLDAGATEITVSIRNGGVDLVRVKYCMLFSLRLCPHATSKLKKCSDLPKMATYGFRGEAMASISYVAQLNFETEL
uniref:Uncharacterized protein n=1 Tax=Ditylenchus dipsaci TaxID=166011 RepID=A0A915DZA2_9BILA